jgi:hypothetical protein
MNRQALESMTRRATAAVTRRSSLLTLGGAALAATMARPDVGEAKKGGQSCGKKQKKKCQAVETQCNAFGTPLCNGNATCLAQVALCCQQCFADAFFACIESAAG